ncbi:MAG: hypothetical protein HY246_18320, partial [Proteobacteria bacterium]|nr:hypothetical protein [Pseudomonadota bacterium]
MESVDLQAALTALVFVILGVVMFALWRLNPADRAPAIWAAATPAAVARRLIDVLPLRGMLWVDLAGDMLVVLSLALLLAGGLVFTRRRVPVVAICTVGTVAIGLCVLLRTIGTPGLWTELPIAAVVAAFLAATAVILLRTSGSDQIVGCKVVGGLLLIRAAVALVLPFLALAPATVDLARLLVSAFAVAIAIGLIVLVLRRQQAVAEGTARALQSQIETRRRAEVEAQQAQRR